MPVYAYRCKECGKEQQHVLKINDRDLPLEKKCECGGSLYRCCGNSGGFRLSPNGSCTWGEGGYSSFYGDAEKFRRK